MPGELAVGSFDNRHRIATLHTVNVCSDTRQLYLNDTGGKPHKNLKRRKGEEMTFCVLSPHSGGPWPNTLQQPTCTNRRNHGSHSAARTVEGGEPCPGRRGPGGVRDTSTGGFPWQSV